MKKTLPQKKKRMHWTEESLKQEAQKYQTLKDFREKSPSAYATYHHKGKPSGVIDHLVNGRIPWSVETAMEEASKYSDRWSFQKKSGGAYRYLWKRSLLDSVFEPLPETASWDEASVRDAASKCNHRTDFKMKYGGAHKWAYEKGILSELFGETYNTPECDNNIVYVWSVKGLPDVYKVGKTSDRLGIRRIKYSCRKGSIEAEQVWLFHTEDAKRLEKNLLSFGKPYDFDYKFSGSTEFRQMNTEELKQCLSLCGQEVNPEAVPNG